MALLGSWRYRLMMGTALVLWMNSTIGLRFVQN